jgi:hypothetical protein
MSMSHDETIEELTKRIQAKGRGEAPFAQAIEPEIRSVAKYALLARMPKHPDEASEV